MDKHSIGTFCWNELATPSLEQAKIFYASVFGWTFDEHVTDEMTYVMIKIDDKEFGGMWQIPTEKQKEIPPHWMSYILVKNVEETLGKATEARATITMPITEVGNFGRFAVIKDPTGAHIAIWETSGKC